MRKTLLRLGAVLLLAGAGCSATQLTSNWQASNAQKPVHHVLVVALVHDEGIRRTAEQDLADRLGKAGVTVQRSSEFVQNGSDLTPEMVASLVQQTQADAVLVTEYMGVQHSTRYEPGARDWYSYYSAAWPGFYGPGYYVEERTVHVSTRLFGTKPNEGMIWSATSQTIDPSSSRQAIASVNKAVVRTLDKDGLI